MVKTFFRKLACLWLSRCARWRIDKNAVVIGITGTNGKTTCKDAVVKIVSKHKKCIYANESFNSEIGLPLTLLELAAPTKKSEWPRLMLRAGLRAFQKKKVEVYVLEYGVDAPGNMDTLTNILRPRVGIFLGASMAHSGSHQFSSVEEIAEEKSKLLAALTPGGTGIVCADNEYAKNAAVPQSCLRVAVGARNAEVTYKNITETKEGLRFEVQHEEEMAVVAVPFPGRHMAPSLLAAIAAAKVLGISFAQSAEALSTFQLPPGRGQLFLGKGGSTLIDSTYNANPASMHASLAMLAMLPAKKKYAVLGQMNELGEASRHEHKKLGEKAARVADVVIGVAGHAKITAHAARKNESYFFETPEEAAIFLEKKLTQNDIVLLKGSQNGVRLERAAKLLLENPADAAALCRQKGLWKKTV